MSDVLLRLVERSLPKCSFCNKDFSQKINMTSHIAKVHVEKKAYKCPLCEKELSILKKFPVQKI